VKKSRRQIINRIFELLAIVLLALSAGAYFGIYRPLGSKVDAAEREQVSLLQTVRNQRVRLELLKKYQAALPGSGKGLQDFTSKRTPSRREAYSTAAHLVHKFADAAGVKVTTMGYRLETSQHDEPLEKLDLAINVQGAYPNLMKFSHALETADDFILVKGFNFAIGGDTVPLALHLDADLFLTP
jgi:Tfp pilus assembly protein PilO